ncbi:HNH endonuclease [Nitratidesulfovibrio vulgaris]|uniref:HNH endonuclease n=1 Tax=Nitratidesulfovibrio vulgaris TaxID=881 RepID=UPI0023015414|nr:HNH endonuclease signature motif containing protein [Nitratidesulfovibrio vulgaris]WCB45049.1 HNH endonuclease signature motif containing protein [Nitratidesulfovibrio vulgaris]
MPARPLRICRHAGCTALTRDPSGLCPHHAECAKEEQRTAQRAHDRTRGNAASRGYGSAWRALRAQVLREEPLCRACAAQGRITAATDVDHIVSRAQGGTDDRANLQPLCHACHSRKTAQQDGGLRGIRGGGR